MEKLTKEMVQKEVADKYQSFFNFFKNEHSLILTIEEMDEILHEAASLRTALESLGEEDVNKNDWVCNECNMPNFKGSVSQEDIESETLSCINCGCFEFHKSKPKT